MNKYKRLFLTDIAHLYCSQNVRDRDISSFEHCVIFKEDPDQTNVVCRHLLSYTILNTKGILTHVSPLQFQC